MILNWTENALADLRSISSYYERSAPTYARVIVHRLFDICEILVEEPRRGPLVPEYDDESIRELFEHPYRIIYRIVHPNRVDIVAVIHAARRLPKSI
ncbi:MAG: type II toxin-antitoxin system RelE/ParE family toxin [Gemmataceae bacterium]